MIMVTVGVVDGGVGSIYGKHGFHVMLGEERDRGSFEYHLLIAFL